MLKYNGILNDVGREGGDGGRDVVDAIEEFLDGEWPWPLGDGERVVGSEEEGERDKEEQRDDGGDDRVRTNDTDTITAPLAVDGSDDRNTNTDTIAAETTGDTLTRRVTRSAARNNEFANAAQAHDN